MSTRKGERVRLYSEVAEKFANVIRNDLIYRQRYSNKKNLSIVTLAKSFDFLDHPQPCPKKTPEVNRLYTTTHYRKEKKQIVQTFKQKLKHNLEQSRLKKQQRNQHLGNLARWKRNCQQTSKLNKKEQMLERKRKQVSIVKNSLGKFKQALDQQKQQNELEYAFKCFQRRMNKYSSKSFSFSK